MKIYPVGQQNQPEVLIGINNVHEEYQNTKPYAVDFIIRPRNSYPGGNYGKYGGYDVILIKLKTAVEMKGVHPICLPASIDFPDTGNATIAGYGRFRRPPCEVGAQGPHRFEFCGVEKQCVKGQPKFAEANCSVAFKYKSKTIK